MRQVSAVLDVVVDCADAMPDVRGRARQLRLR
jgi:hypothetical protein